MYMCTTVQYVICHVKSKNDQKKNIEIFLLSGTWYEFYIDWKDSFCTFRVLIIT